MAWEQILSAGISATANTGAGLLNFVQQRHTNLENWKRQDRLNQLNLDMYHYDNWYNSPAEQMARMRAAGLNPGLMYGGSGSVATSMTPPEMKGSTDIAPQMSGLPTISDVLAVARSQAEIENIKADTENKREVTRGKEIENEVARMNKSAFESAYSEGLVHAAVASGYYKEIDDSRISRYQMFESAWNFAILTGTNLSQSLSSSDLAGTDSKDFDTGLSVPFEFSKDSFKRAESLYIGGSEAQFWANKAAEVAAKASAEQKKKDVDIFKYLNDAAESDNWIERTAARIALLGLFMAEQRFSLPSFNLNIDRGQHTHKTTNVYRND